MNPRDDKTEKKCEGAWFGVKSIKRCRHIESSETSNFPRVDIFKDVVCKFEQRRFGRVEFEVPRLKRTDTGSNRYVGKKACKSRSLQNFANCIRIRNGPEIGRLRVMTN